MINNMTEGSVAKHLVIFSIPLILSNLLQTLYNVVDMMIVGRFVGSEGLSAVSVGGDIMHLPLMMCMGFCTAGQVMISQYVGKDDRDNISCTIGTMLTALFVGFVVLAGVGIAFNGTLLSLMNAPVEAWNDARDYIIVSLMGMVFTFGYNAFSAVLRGMGDSRRPLIFIAVATVTNIALDLLFVAVFGMRAFGAALATIISQAVSLVCSVIHLYRRRESFGFDFKPSSFAIKKDKLLPLLRMGLPMALQTAAINISIMAVNAQINALGVTVSAVTGVGNKLRNLGTVITHSVSTAAIAVIAQNLGARKLDRASRTVYTALGINFVICTLMAAIFALFPEAIFGMFTEDAEVISWARSHIYTVIVHNYASALMGPFNSLISGLGYASLSLVIGLLDGVVARIGLALFMGITLGMGALGFWYGGALAGFVTTILAGAYFFSGRWKRRRLLVDEKQ